MAAVRTPPCGQLWLPRYRFSAQPEDIFPSNLRYPTILYAGRKAFMELEIS